MTCPGWGVLLFSQESWTAYHVEALLSVTSPAGEPGIRVGRVRTAARVLESTARAGGRWEPVEQPARHPSTLWPLMIQFLLHEDPRTTSHYCSWLVTRSKARSKLSAPARPTFHGEAQEK